MPRAAGPEQHESRDLNRVIGWFISIRWVAGGCVVATVLVADVVFSYSLPYPALYAATAALFGANTAFAFLYHRYPERWHDPKHANKFFHGQITTDYVILLLLIYLAGFLESPFAPFFVFHVMLTGFLFEPPVVARYGLGLVVIIVAVALGEYLAIIPHFALFMDMAAYRAQILPRAVGLSTTIVITGYLISSIKSRIEERGRRVEVELDRYRQLDRAKSNFILQVTHELRGPVAAVSGFHEMVLRGITGEIEPKTKAVIEKADRRTENLLTIIDEMIDFAYMKSDDEQRYATSSIALRPVVADALRNHEPHAERKDTRLVSDVPDDIVLAANRDLLNIVLGNLVNNAIKYSPEGSEVVVRARREDDGVRLSVADTGYGIEPDELEKVFEEFYRSRRARELERDGTGLGLPIVKRAVEAMGGRIAVYSVPGEGTTFDIHLPTEERHGERNEEDSDHRR